MAEPEVGKPPHSIRVYNEDAAKYASPKLVEKMIEEAMSELMKLRNALPPHPLPHEISAAAAFLKQWQEEDQKKLHMLANPDMDQRQITVTAISNDTAPPLQYTSSSLQELNPTDIATDARYSSTLSVHESPPTVSDTSRQHSITQDVSGTIPDLSRLPSISDICISDIRSAVRKMCTEAMEESALEERRKAMALLHLEDRYRLYDAWIEKARKAQHEATISSCLSSREEEEAKNSEPCTLISPRLPFIKSMSLSSSNASLSQFAGSFLEELPLSLSKGMLLLSVSVSASCFLVLQML